MSQNPSREGAEQPAEQLSLNRAVGLDDLQRSSSLSGSVKN